MTNSTRFLPELDQRSRKALFYGWAMYVISFGLPFMDDMRGYDGFWLYFEEMSNIDSFDLDTLSMLAINASNIMMILSPLLLLKGFNHRSLGVILILGGLHNTRFIWKLDPDILETMKELFPAYYVWWLSFLVCGVALWRAPTVRAA
jgi:hypothetical protein